MNLRSRGLKTGEPPAGGVGQLAVLVHGTGRRWPAISSAASQPCPSSLNGLHQRLAEGGQQSREQNRPAIFRPRLALHLDQELAIVGERDPGKLDFEVFISLQIFDRNSQVRFHKRLIARRLQKSPVHDPVQSQSYIK